MRKVFESWARLGNRTYLDAQNANELAGAISQAVNAPFEVTDPVGSVVVTGTSNGDAVNLPVGSYKVRYRNNSGTGSTAVIEVDEETVVTLD